MLSWFTVWSASESVATVSCTGALCLVLPMVGYRLVYCGLHVKAVTTVSCTGFVFGVAHGRVQIGVPVACT
jgi:hypothetical protein